MTSAALAAAAPTTVLAPQLADGSEIPNDEPLRSDVRGQLPTEATRLTEGPLAGVDDVVELADLTRQVTDL
jgi:hypothetical protein